MGDILYRGRLIRVGCVIVTLNTMPAGQPAGQRIRLGLRSKANKDTMRIAKLSAKHGIWPASPEKGSSLWALSVQNIR